MIGEFYFIFGSERGNTALHNFFAAKTIKSDCFSLRENNTLCVA